MTERMSDPGVNKLADFGEIAQVKRSMSHSQDGEITGKNILHHVCDIVRNPRNFL